MFNLGANHIGIGDNSQQVVFLINYRKLLDSASEDHPGSIVDVHLRVCNDQIFGYYLVNRRCQLDKKKIPGRDITNHYLAINNREPVMMCFLDFFDNVFNCAVDINTDDIVGHIVLDPFFIHHYSF